jgi:DNA invertase Pin-like site-specific DNA recombinase
MARAKNLGLVYARRSTDKQEISLPSQIEWAAAAATRQGVTLDAVVTDLAHMQALHLHSYKDIRLDDGISGSDLTCPGFLAVSRDARGDKTISHVFIYKRDRFARPNDAMQAAQLEKQLLTAGITLVFSDTVSAPIRLGDQSIMRDMELLLAYYQGGEELRKHAERVLGFQKTLAEGGYRVGGNPPYGFVRVLVDASGNVLEELPLGKTVRQPGCHVRAMPKDVEKIAVWLQLLEYKERG